MTDPAGSSIRKIRFINMADPACFLDSPDPLHQFADLARLPNRQIRQIRSINMADPAGLSNRWIRFTNMADPAAPSARQIRFINIADRAGPTTRQIARPPSRQIRKIRFGFSRPCPVIFQGGLRPPFF